MHAAVTRADIQPEVLVVDRDAKLGARFREPVRSCRHQGRSHRGPDPEHEHLRRALCRQLSGANCSTMSSCLARAIFCASSRSTPASTTSLGHTRASGRNSLCLECPRLRVVSWHSLSSVACITTTGEWPDTHGVVWIEKVASTSGVDSLSYDIYVDAVHTVVWSSTPVAVVPLNNTAVDFYGSIFALQDVSVGSYTDTVVVTLNFSLQVRRERDYFFVEKIRV